MKNFGRSTKQEDPVVHFYETFLGEYNPALRKARGVWYTPQPVVNFIVRAVDDILKTEFDLPQGLADTSKIKIKKKAVTQTLGKNAKIKEVETEVEVHKVQILDPATGTGTFLAEVVKHIHKKFEGQQGIWSKYVTKDLIPRLNGFELLMASYAMAHLKMDMLLTETGYKPTDDQRFRIFLTNSLEEAHPDTQTLFSSWLSDEADQANAIKRDAPVMVVIGNPPYSGISSNNGKWISDLIEDYKYIDGEHFNERKHWLNDDYVKFMRFGQHFIDKNGSGVLAFINPHGFLDNPTFRGMRWHLMQSFDKIYTIDLHGNSKKKETAPDGSFDQNVFDIMQGVSINLFIKTGKKKEKELGKVFHYDLFGKRDLKYDFLSENSLKAINFVELNPEKPYMFFVQKNYEGKTEYENGFNLDKLFNNFNSGMVTANDSLTVFNSKEELKKTTNEIINSLNPFEKYNIKDSRRATQAQRLNDLKNAVEKGEMLVNFRPFDFKYMYQFDKNEHWINSPRYDIMKHFLRGSNIGIVVSRQCTEDWKHILYTNVASDFNLTGTAGRYGSGYIFPLYLYPETTAQQTLDGNTERTPNLNPEIVKQIEEGLGIAFVSEKEHTPNPSQEGNKTFAPIDLLDYIYAVLHSPSYREKYKEFLKIDFPRVPYPTSLSKFQTLTKLGSELRQIHLLESPVVEDFITQYPEDGTNIVGKLYYEKTTETLGRVYINHDKTPPSGVGGLQYFENVPEVAWNFYIGGYQPAQKWLKDRKERELSYEDILHYQKIIVALSETDRIMKEIDTIEI
jgi:predicted helicase